MISDLEALQALCRDKFAPFATKAFELIEPGVSFEYNWHIDCIAEHLEAVYRGELTRLIINLPPRTLKSYLVARAFPAWVLGKTPQSKFIVTSYGYEVAEQNSMACRRIMKDPWYLETFKNTRINAELDRNTHYETTQAGQYYAASALSPLTGMGCDYCFIGSTKILTQSGYKKIMDISIGDKIWSYNHEKRCQEIKPVTALFRRRVSGLVQVETISGDRVICTPNHPFWIEGRGYKEAKDLKAMDRLIASRIYEREKTNLYSSVRLLLQGISQKTLRLPEVIGQRFCGALLFKYMLQGTSQHKKSSQMQNMQRENIFQESEILREVSRRNIWERAEKPIRQAVPNDSLFNRISRWLQMHGLLKPDQEVGASYKRGQKGQQPNQSYYDVPDMPPAASHWHFDNIKSITPYGNKEYEVYDITVDGNHNFFAEGILVHNCIADDLLKPMEASSDTIRTSTNINMRTTFFSRFNDKRTGRFVLVMQRLHEDDPTGNLMRDGGYTLLKLPAEVNKPVTISLGPKTWVMHAGDLLFPARLSRAILDQTALDMSEANYAGQYLQEPVPLGSGEFREDWLQYYRAGGIKPKEMNTVILVDPAGGEELNKKKKKTSDWTVMAVLGLAADNNYYLLDMIRDRLNPTERIDTLFTLHRMWNELTGKSPKVGYEKYGMMTDTHYIKEKQRTDAYNFPIIELGGRTMKEERIRRMIPDLQNGRFYFPATLPYVDTEGRKFDLIAEMKGEMASFPRARWDDILDTISRIYESELYLSFPKKRGTILSRAFSAREDAQPDSWENF